MKKIRFILIVPLFILGSCNILDVEPSDMVEQDDVFNSESGVKSAIVGCYNTLQSTGAYGRDIIGISDLLAENLEETGTTQEYAQFQIHNVLADNALIEGVWAAGYSGINECNMVLSKLSESDLSNKASYEAHARFIRAIHYYNLVRFFGDLPLKTTPTLNAENLDIPRSPVNDVYELIIDDLNFASNQLPIEPLFMGAATKGSAQAALASVYLTIKDYSNAQIMASQVIDGENYELVSDFTGLYPAEHNTESIFEIEFNDIDNTTMAQYFLLTEVGGRHEWTPSTSLISSYSANDNRKSLIVQSGTDIYGNKYNEISSRSDNVYVFRLAEMYLIRAEANARLNNDAELIRQDVNKIRDRAGLDTLTTLNYQELLADILIERKLEFAFEGKHWFDLIRTDSALTVIEDINNRNQYLMPIPISEMQTNKNMTQNQGY